MDQSPGSDYRSRRFHRQPSRRVCCSTWSPYSLLSALHIARIAGLVSRLTSAIRVRNCPWRCTRLRERRSCSSGCGYYLSSRRIGRNSLFVSFATIVCSDKHRGNPKYSGGGEAAWSQRLICTSTSEVYGSATYVPMDEKHALQAQSPYSASKIGADKIADSYQSSFGLPVSIARPFNCYGPRQSSRAVIPTIVTQALTQSSVNLGNIHTIRDFTFVSDIVEGSSRSQKTRQPSGRP